MIRRRLPGTVLDETGRVRDLYDRMAPCYDAVITVPERMLLADGRQWACRQATGRVLEVAIGTGRNLGFYPPGIDLVGIDLSPPMLELARANASELPGRVELRVADAQSIPFDDVTFDTVVATLSLCSIPDDRRAVAEMARVLLDHVASPLPLIQRVQRLLDPVLVRCMGDHLLRQPQLAAQEAGLVIDQLTRSSGGPSPVSEPTSQLPMHPRRRGVRRDGVHRTGSTQESHAFFTSTAT